MSKTKARFEAEWLDEEGAVHSDKVSRKGVSMSSSTKELNLLRPASAPEEEKKQ